MTTISLTLKNGNIQVKTPYSAEFVEDLKATIPLHGRYWNGKDKVWEVAYIYGQDIVNCIKGNYDRGQYGNLKLPVQKTSVPQDVIKLLKIEYIGAAKERQDGSISATGWSNGQWSVILPVNVLKAWFNDEYAEPTFGVLSLYGVLGVKKKATQKEVKRAYRIASKTWHPDVNDDPNAAKQFHRINDA